MLKLLGPIEIVGIEHIPDDRPVVFAANHRSLADLWVGLSVFASINVFPGILFKKTMLPGPLAQFAEAMGVILVSKGGATEAGISALERGRSLMVMPEGGLHWDEDNPRQLGPIRPGIARMARATERPMVPVAVDGTEIVWPHGRWPRFNPFSRKTIVVTFGPAHRVGADETDQEAADSVMASVSSALTA